MNKYPVHIQYKLGRVYQIISELKELIKDLRYEVQTYSGEVNDATRYALIAVELSETLFFILNSLALHVGITFGKTPTTKKKELKK